MAIYPHIDCFYEWNESHIKRKSADDSRDCYRTFIIKNIFIKKKLWKGKITLKGNQKTVY